jgi:hypothetical protein
MTGQQPGRRPHCTSPTETVQAIDRLHSTLDLKQMELDALDAVEHTGVALGGPWSRGDWARAAVSTQRR